MMLTLVRRRARGDDDTVLGTLDRILRVASRLWNAGVLRKSSRSEHRGAKPQLLALLRLRQLQLLLAQQVLVLLLQLLKCLHLLRGQLLRRQLLRGLPTRHLVQLRLQWLAV